MSTWKPNKAQRRQRERSAFLGGHQVSPVKVTDVFGNQRLEAPLSRDEVVKITRKRRKSS